MLGIGVASEKQMPILSRLVFFHFCLGAYAILLLCYCLRPSHSGFCIRCVYLFSGLECPHSLFYDTHFMLVITYSNQQVIWDKKDSSKCCRLLITRLAYDMVSHEWYICVPINECLHTVSRYNRFHYFVNGRSYCFANKSSYLCKNIIFSTRSYGTRTSGKYEAIRDMIYVGYTLPRCVSISVTRKSLTCSIDLRLFSYGVPICFLLAPRGCFGNVSDNQNIQRLLKC